MENTHIHLKQMSSSDRPYERFLAGGPECLSDAELLAVIIKNGCRNESAIELSQRILSQGGKGLLNLFRLPYEELMQFKGIGQVKAIQLKCIGEISKRMAKASYAKDQLFDSSQKIADYFREQLRHEKRELVIALYLDCHMRYLAEEVLNSGSTSFAFFPIGEILRRAILKNAQQIVILHNHPSGDPYPSGDDIRVTHRIHDAAALLGMELTDHIIIGDQDYFSFCESHILEEI